MTDVPINEYDCSRPDNANFLFRQQLKQLLGQKQYENGINVKNIVTNIGHKHPSKVDMHRNQLEMNTMFISVYCFQSHK